MKTKQSVRVTVHRRSKTKKGASITRFELPLDAIGPLVDVLVRAAAEGLAVNSRGEVQFYLSSYDAEARTAKGLLGVVRTGAKETVVEDVVGATIAT